MAVYRLRNKTEPNDSADAALAGASLTTTEIFTENITPRGDYFGCWIDVSSVSGGNVLVLVYHSEDGGTTWASYPAAKGATASANAQAGLPAISADGAASGFWDNCVPQSASPASLIRFGIDMSAGTATLDKFYFFEGALGGK